MNEETQKPTVKPKRLTPWMRIAIPVVAIALSLVAGLQIVFSKWGSSDPEKPTYGQDHFMEASRKQASLCVMKVLAKGSAVKTEELNWAERRVSEPAVRGWTSASLVDVVVDLGQAEISKLPSKTNTVLEVVLPPPKFDERTLAFKPGSTRLVVEHENLNDDVFRKWSVECFGKIQKAIDAAVQSNSILPRAREPARTIITGFYRGLGADDVTVLFQDEISKTNTQN